MPTVLVTGANRGIGLEFVRQYAADGWRVIATARATAEASDLTNISGDVRVQPLDVADFHAVSRFGEGLGGDPLDVLIANAGVMGPQRMETSEDGEAWIEMMRVNSVAPVLLAKSVLGNVAAAKGKLVAITSRMGSIEDNGSGGYIAYRASKAALNAAWKSLSIDVKGRGIACAVLHPGWVQTRMGGGGAPLAPEDSVSNMRRTIDKLDAGESGGFFNYDGAPIPW
jgi:NAD(P)-dependent dehydrogenase (short-subunit alcohol dehydrogenase family)